MAEKKKERPEGSGNNKGIGILLGIMIVITWLSVMCLLIKCDVGGFGSKVLRPVLKDIPVINKILPDASDEETAGNWDRLSEVLHNFQQEHQCMVDVTWKKKVWQIDVSQILYIQSADNYSRVVFYLQGELVQALQSYTMKEWERILSEQGFCRISRFVIVNYAYVEDIQKTSLIMEDSMRFNIPNGKVRRLRQEYIAYAREHERVL